MVCRRAKGRKMVEMRRKSRAEREEPNGHWTLCPSELRVMHLFKQFTNLAAPPVVCLSV